MPAAARFRPALFDLLADEAPGAEREAEPRRKVARAALLESVRAELERLLGSRRDSQPRLAPLSVIDYGVPDWSALHADRGADREQLARAIRQAIQAFEPRLARPEVTVAAVAGRRQTLSIEIRGELAAAGETWPVAFIARLGEGGASLARAEDEA
ncbi:type VI secretion system baseplate subunit TssE [Chromobacterium paludis]|uniref:Type VI secretion system baseplate subunit TssE n=1 Tax=Chromobacterium paludis TaxID=2605945 RepID=A0A5C1DGZ9_9NEIS|nr:type VI secretion system baseplate subunit TssE [Chromobacterium paludis]QEL55954.1 type VI secretion system baseplate subunit TssE [Chromobacterium paludis]